MKILLQFVIIRIQYPVLMAFSNKDVTLKNGRQNWKITHEDLKDKTSTLGSEGS